MPESAVKFGSYEVRPTLAIITRTITDTLQAAKKVVARLEGHSDTKKIASTSQFIAGGLAGMFSQYGTPVSPISIH